MMKRLVAGALAVTAVLGGTAAAAAAATAAAATTPETIVVAPSGDDRAAGTTTHPVRSIQTAVDRVTHGGTVELRGGIYHERGLLTGVQHLMIRPYRHEHPVLSGRGLTPPPGLTAMVEIASVTDVTVTGLEITGYRTTRLGVVPAGIYVHGYDRGVRLTNNHVHHLGNDNPTLGSFDINAHGIAVYGDDPHAPITGVAVDGNELDHLKLGASETLVLNGNVTNWSVVGNHIHDDNNIGIDAIGFEGTLPGRYRYTQRNRARHGLIANNTVSDIRSRGNPAYWEGDGWCNCADGIYVDGGTQLTIRGNHVTGSDIGVEVAAENARGSADHVAVIRNRIEGSLFTGITTGGYCDGKRDCGQVRTGTSHDNVFAYNVLRHNNQLDDGSPELLVQYHAYRNTFVHNTIDPARGQLVIYGTVDRSDSTGNHSDHNQFVGPANGLIFGWQRHTYIGFAAYRAGSGQDARSRVRMLPRRPASGGSRHGSDASRGDDGGYSARSFACVLPCRRLR